MTRVVTCDVYAYNISNSFLAGSDCPLPRPLLLPSLSPLLLLLCGEGAAGGDSGHCVQGTSSAPATGGWNTWLITFSI